MEFVIIRDEFSDDSDCDSKTRSDDDTGERLRHEEDYNRAEVCVGGMGEKMYVTDVRGRLRRGNVGIYRAG